MSEAPEPQASNPRSGMRLQSSPPPPGDVESALRWLLDRERIRDLSQRHVCGIEARPQLIGGRAR